MSGALTAESETLYYESVQQRLLFLAEEDRRFYGREPCAAVRSQGSL